MMYKADDHRVEKMASLVTDKLYWAPEPALDVLVQEFPYRGRGIIP